MREGRRPMLQATHDILAWRGQREASPVLLLTEAFKLFGLVGQSLSFCLGWEAATWQSSGVSQPAAVITGCRMDLGTPVPRGAVGQVTGYCWLQMLCWILVPARSSTRRINQYLHCRDRTNNSSSCWHQAHQLPGTGPVLCVPVPSLGQCGGMGLPASVQGHGVELQ